MFYNVFMINVISPSLVSNIKMISSLRPILFTYVTVRMAHLLHYTCLLCGTPTRVDENVWVICVCACAMSVYTGRYIFILLNRTTVMGEHDGSNLSYFRCFQSQNYKQNKCKFVSRKQKLMKRKLTNFGVCILSVCV